MQYMRVSEILARLQNFSNINKAILDEKARIGTCVHDLIYKDANGEEAEPECLRSKAYFESYLQYKESVKPCYMMMEARFEDDKLMITGQLDAIARMNGELVIHDWKTSASPNRKIWEMQAHFYWYLLKQNNVPVGNKMIWVNLRHDKKALHDENGEPVLDIFDTPMKGYVALQPRILEFEFKEEVLSQCILEAEKAWEEKKANFDVDY